jgi:hypothetical protein
VLAPPRHDEEVHRIGPQSRPRRPARLARAGRRARVASVLVALTMVAALPGCGLLPHRGGSPTDGPASGPGAPQGPLAACLTAAPGPSPTATIGPGSGTVPAARTADRSAGISYPAYPAPWVTMSTTWTTPRLGLHFVTGQSFVAETAASGVPNYALIMSTRVPTAVNDGTVDSVHCAGPVIATDVRNDQGYRPLPGERLLTEGDRLVDGHPAWLSIVELTVHDGRFRSRTELSGVLVVSTGAGMAALVVEVPGVVSGRDAVVDQVLGAVRVG